MWYLSLPGRKTTTLLLINSNWAELIALEIDPLFKWNIQILTAVTIKLLPVIDDLNLKKKRIVVIFFDFFAKNDRLFKKKKKK